MSELYYHFVGANKCLRKGSEHEDIEVVPGLKLVFNGEPVLCERGFHASKRPLDALKHAPDDSEWLCGVRLSGTIIHGEDKSVATERTVVWMLNVRKLLVEFALWNVEQAFAAIRKIGIEPDERSVEAVRLVRLWLVDEASKEELSAAADTARAADADAYAATQITAARAADAADAAICAAADTAVYTAAGAAICAAICAADSAARAAVGAYGNTYYAAAREAQNGQLEKMIRAELRVQNAK